MKNEDDFDRSLNFLDSILSFLTLQITLLTSILTYFNDRQIVHTRNLKQRD